MRYGSIGLVALSFFSLSAAGPFQLVHQQRYSMGTMFEIVVYHESPREAERATDAALAEVLRLDQVMSHYKADSELSRVVREARNGFVTVEPSLFEVLETALDFSRRSAGTFDMTIAPLLKVWKQADADRRRPTADETARARRCVGYQQVETQHPDRVRFTSPCVEIDLGGIGKGYAVDRALAILRSAGIRHAVVNAGGSSIAAIGTPPGKGGWPVSLGGDGSRTFSLRDASIATSQQGKDGGSAGEIIDVRTGAPTAATGIVSVVAPSAAVSDALSTTLLLLSIDEGRTLLAQFAGVSALWIAPSGELRGTYGSALW